MTTRTVPSAPEDATSHAEIDTPEVSQKPTLGKMLLFGGLTAIGPLTIDMYLAAFPAVSADLDVSTSTVQLTLTATLVGLAVGQLVLGSLSDALGRRRPLIISLSLYILFSTVVALTSSVPLLFAMRFAQGVTASAGMVLSMAMVRDLYAGTAMARLLSRLMLITSVAPILAPTIGAQFLHFGSWRTMFWGLGAFGLLLVIVALVLVKETLPEHRRAKGGVKTAFVSYGILLRSPRFLGVAFTGAAAMGTMFTYISSATFVYQDLFGMDVQTYALAFAAGAIMTTIGSQVSASLVLRTHPVKIVRGALISGSSVAAVMFVSALMGGPPLLIILLILAVLFCVGLIMPNNPTIALNGQQNRAGSAAALLGALLFVMGASLAPVTGLFPQTSAAPMAGMMLFSMLLGLSLFYFVARPKKIIASMPWSIPSRG